MKSECNQNKMRETNEFPSSSCSRAGVVTVNNKNIPLHTESRLVLIRKLKSHCIAVNSKCHRVNGVISPGCTHHFF